MIAPIPETRTAIVLLNGSRVRPNGTWKTPLIPIHVSPAAAAVECAKIKQLQIKLTSTAAIEIELLNAFHRSVNNVITAVLSRGARRIIHGKIEVIRLAARESRELTRMGQNDEARITNDERSRMLEDRGTPAHSVLAFGFRHSLGVKHSIIVVVFTFATGDRKRKLMPDLLLFVPFRVFRGLKP